MTKGGAGPVWKCDEGSPHWGLEEFQGADEAQPVWKSYQANQEWSIPKAAGTYLWFSTGIWNDLLLAS